jgi:hypothetical protein
METLSTCKLSTSLTILIWDWAYSITAVANGGNLKANCKSPVKIMLQSHFHLLLSLSQLSGQLDLNPWTKDNE